MTDPVTLRDSTQIVLARGALDGTRESIESEFAVSVHEAGASVRIIGSPVEIKTVTRFLARCGFSLP